MAELFKGKAVADAITESLISRSEKLKEQGVVPTLAILRVGAGDADLSYERNAIKRCEKVGIDVAEYVLPDSTSCEELLEVIQDINENERIHGCLMFRPLKDKKMEELASNALDPKKDVDCMTDGNFAGLFLGRENTFAPCTAQSCLEILDFYGVELSGKNVCVLGRSAVVGKPLSMMLLGRNATVTTCHTKTKDTASIAKKADILIVAAGKAGLVTADYTHENQILIDVGINVVDDKIVGDVDFDSCEPICKALTPVPGGVGSVTTSVLAKAVILAAERKAKNG